MNKMIDKLIEQLVLYSEGDRIYQINFWKHPDIGQVQQLQRQMINLLFPGRAGETPKDLPSFC